MNSYQKYTKPNRNKNRKKYYEEKKRNYAKGAKHAYCSYGRWTETDLKKIISPNRPTDRILAIDIKRSVQAIQIKRGRLINGHIS